ncbi:MAG: hypothetical protein AABX25_00225 [Nanoarchaeota archaeon]
MDNKKIIIGFNILALFILLSTIAYARPVTDAAFDSIRGGLVQVNNFFAGQQYQPYAKAIDFFFFSFLFIAIYMMGARYAFKEIKRPEQVIVILLGLMTAFLLVLANVSAVALLPFIHWLFYLLLFILFWWLLKGIKNNFWRFILALLLTLLTIGLIQGLFNTLTAPQFGTIGAPDTSGFGFGNFFKDWGNNFGTIGIPQFTTPGLGGVSDWGSNLFGKVDTTKITGPVTETTTPKETVKITKETTTTTTTATTGEKKTASSWWWLLPLLALLATGGFFGWRNRNKLRLGRVKDLFKRKKTTKEQIAIEQVLEELKKYFKIKYEFLVKLYDIYRRKKKLKDKIDEYHKKLYGIIYGLKKDEDISLLLDPDHRLHQEFLNSGTNVDELIKKEIKLHDDLKELLRIEYEISGYNGKTPIFENGKIKQWEKGKTYKWKETIEKIFIKPPEQPEFLRLQSPVYQKYAFKLQEYLNSLQDVTNDAKIAVQQYYSITGASIKADRELKELLKPDELEKWIKRNAKERWVKLIAMKDRESNNPEAYRRISNFLTNAKDKDCEPGFLRLELFMKLNKEKNHLKYIYWLAKLLNDIELKTIIQNLRVNKKVDEKGELKWVEATEEARTKGLAYGTPIQIYTRVAQGKPNFTANCFIYKKSGSVWKLKWWNANFSPDPTADFRYKVPYPGRETKYTYVAPGVPPAIPSRQDFRLPDGTVNEEAYATAEAEYSQKLKDYNLELAQKSETVPEVIGEVVFSSDDPEKGFGDLDPGEYKFIVMTRGRRDYNEQESQENFYPPEVIESSKLEGMPPSALKRYGWDYKESIVIIKGGKETETVPSKSKIIKVNGNEVNQQKIVRMDKSIGLKSVESVIENNNYKFVFYRVYKYRKGKIIRKENLDKKIEYETLTIPLTTNGILNQDGTINHIISDIDKKLEEGSYRLIGYLTKDTTKKNQKPFDSVKIEVVELLKVKIIRPERSPVPTLFMGQNLTLEAEVIGEDTMLENLTKEINEERGHSFEWFIEQKGSNIKRLLLFQGKRQAAIHIGRRTHAEVPEYIGEEASICVLHSYGAVPEEFYERPAKLIVKVIRNDNLGNPVEILSDSIDVVLKKSPAVPKPEIEKLKPALTVQIIQPQPTPTPVLIKGLNIQVEAKVEGEDEIVNDVNNEKGYSFEWYVVQSKANPLKLIFLRGNYEVPIHVGRRTRTTVPEYIGEENQSICVLHSYGTVPENLRNGNAILLVVVRKVANVRKDDGSIETQSIEIARNSIDVVLEAGKSVVTQEVSREGLTLKITEPVFTPESPTILYIENFLSLEAQVVGGDGSVKKLAEEINREEGYTFEWYIEQSNRWRILNPFKSPKLDKVHEGRVTEFIAPIFVGERRPMKIHSDRVVDESFREGYARLIVQVKKNDEVILSSSIDVKIEKLTVEAIVKEERKILEKLRGAFGNKLESLMKALHEFEVNRLNKTMYAGTISRNLNIEIVRLSGWIREKVRGRFLHEALQLEMLEDKRLGALGQGEESGKKQTEEGVKELTEDEIVPKLRELYRKIQLLDGEINKEIERERVLPENEKEAEEIAQIWQALEYLRVKFRYRAQDVATAFYILRAIEDQNKVLEIIRDQVRRVGENSFWVAYETLVGIARNIEGMSSNKEINLRVIRIMYEEFSGHIDATEKTLKGIIEIQAIKTTDENKKLLLPLWQRVIQIIKDLREKKYVPTMRINLLRLQGMAVEAREELPPEDKKTAEKVAEAAEKTEDEIRKNEESGRDSELEAQAVEEENAQKANAVFELAARWFNTLRRRGSSALNFIADEFEYLREEHIKYTGRTRLMKLSPSLQQTGWNLGDKNILQPAEFVPSPVPPQIRRGGFTTSNRGGKTSITSRTSGVKKGGLNRSPGKGEVNYRTQVQKRVNQSLRKVWRRR